MANLVIFDLDGTIVHAPEFYRQVYSGTLTTLIAEQRGDEGLEVLAHCRKHYGGKGELALFALNIPFTFWAERLINASLDLIQPDPALVERLRSLPVKKVIYTGSPMKMAWRLLEKFGFRAEDFDLLIGWEEPDFFPLKWSCSPFLFKLMLANFHCEPNDAWAVGDDWETDLAPAQAIGMGTARVRKEGGDPDIWFPTLSGFLAHIGGLI